MLVLPLAGYAQQAVLSVTPKDIKDVPHRLWAKSLTFTDTLTRHPDKGRTIEIRKTTYYRLETKGLGGLAYCSANVIDTLQTAIQTVDAGATVQIDGVTGNRFEILPTLGPIVISEIHADPEATILGDANGDGVRDASDDEFVELLIIVRRACLHEFRKYFL